MQQCQTSHTSPLCQFAVCAWPGGITTTPLVLSTVSVPHHCSRREEEIAREVNRRGQGRKRMKRRSKNGEKEQGKENVGVQQNSHNRSTSKLVHIAMIGPLKEKDTMIGQDISNPPFTSVCSSFSCTLPLNETSSYTFLCTSQGTAHAPLHSAAHNRKLSLWAQQL